VTDWPAADEYSERLDEEMSSPVTTLQSCQRQRENASAFTSPATEAVTVPSGAGVVCRRVLHCTFLLGFLSATR
jgi:hypothetical protein